MSLFGCVGSGQLVELGMDELERFAVTKRVVCSACQHSVVGEDHARQWGSTYRVRIRPHERARPLERFR